MPLELYMLGLIVKDMSKSLAFYQRLGLAISAESADQTHVKVEMGNGFTFFLDSDLSQWDPKFVRRNDSEHTESYHSVLEFYLKTRDAVDAKYAELTSLGYQGYRAPYETFFGMYFAMVNDPDGNTILLSGDLQTNELTSEGKEK